MAAAPSRIPSRGLLTTALLKSEFESSNLKCEGEKSATTVLPSSQIDKSVNDWDLSHEDLFDTGGAFDHNDPTLASSPVDCPPCWSSESHDCTPPGSPLTLKRNPVLCRVASSTSVDIPTTPDDEEDAKRLRSHLVGPSVLTHMSTTSRSGADEANEAPQKPLASTLLADSSNDLEAVMDQCSTTGRSAHDPESDKPPDGAGSAPGKPRIGPADFDILSLVGQGAFGKVFQVQQRATGRIYAMKVMKKAVVIERNQADYMRTERDVLTVVDHPFVVTIRFSFQTTAKLYLVLDFINGGHLFFQLYRAGIFEEALARLYTAEILLALTHLHSLGIAHRDLKPENILLDAEGHIRVTDFGLAKVITDGSRHNSLVGTIDYMAPEIVSGRGHGMAADWWSLGILLFEMLTGAPPFRAKNRAVLQKKITSEKIKYPPFLSSQAHKLLTGLLQREEARRLGAGPEGAAAVQQHEFFKGLNWKKLLAKEILAPFRPQVANERCTANFDEMWTKMPALDSPTSTPEMDEKDAFVGYTYCRESHMDLAEAEVLLRSMSALNVTDGQAENIAACDPEDAVEIVDRKNESIA